MSKKQSRSVEWDIIHAMLHRKDGIARIEAAITKALDDHRRDHITEAERAELWQRYMVLHSVNLDAPRPDNDSD